ncbi:YkvA family protein [Mesobacillus zeae]|uniref:DUF1232 domain-containing protein n=1 Tax=Mesobacillus zeae TaxID=1917180 RepID=A0A398BIC8_9BACI|nr:DUF1232 domain-containing protein [Mesobacillus zeae]RID87480.1 DUF1232 domain-containing protein [Mesobacillus zeae]
MRKLFKRFKFVFKFWKFIPFIKDFFLSREVKANKKIIGLVLILAYAFFPFDLIPDFLAFFGVIDDIVIAGFVLERMVKLAPDSLKEKHGLPETL